MLVSNAIIIFTTVTMTIRFYYDIKVWALPLFRKGIMMSGKEVEVNGKGFSKFNQLQ